MLGSFFVLRKLISLSEESEVLSYHDARKYPKKIWRFIIVFLSKANISFPLLGSLQSLKKLNGTKYSSTVKYGDYEPRFSG